MTRTKLSARLQTTVSMLNLTPRQRGICWLRQAGVQWVLALALALAGLGWSGKLGGSVAFVRTAIEKIGQVEAARRLINQEKERFIDKLFESTSIANQPVRHENRFDRSISSYSLFVKKASRKTTICCSISSGFNATFLT